jgi:hypothetical protein
VGAEGMEVNVATNRHPENIIKRSQIVFAVTLVALSLKHLSTRLLGLPAQSLIESRSTLITRPNCRLEFFL